MTSRAPRPLGCSSPHDDAATGLEARRPDERLVCRSRSDVDTGRGVRRPESAACNRRSRCEASGPTAPAAPRRSPPHPGTKDDLHVGSWDRAPTFEGRFRPPDSRRARLGSALAGLPEARSRALPDFGRAGPARSGPAPNAEAPRTKGPRTRELAASGDPFRARRVARGTRYDRWPPREEAHGRHRPHRPLPRPGNRRPGSRGRLATLLVICSRRGILGPDGGTSTEHIGPYATEARRSRCGPRR